MGAPVAKKRTIGDWEPEVMSKEPAFFFGVDHELRLVRDSLGPVYCVRTMHSCLVCKSHNGACQSSHCSQKTSNCVVRIRRSQVVSKVLQEFSRMCRVLWNHGLIPRQGAPKCPLVGLMTIENSVEMFVASRVLLPTQ